MLLFDSFCVNGSGILFVRGNRSVISVPMQTTCQKITEGSIILLNKLPEFILELLI